MRFHRSLSFNRWMMIRKGNTKSFMHSIVFDFRYIFTSLHLENSTNLSCIKILIRLARTSKAVAESIVSHGDLLTSIFEQFDRIPQTTDSMCHLEIIDDQQWCSNQNSFCSCHHSGAQCDQSRLAEIVSCDLCIRWRCVHWSIASHWTGCTPEKMCFRTRERCHGRDGQTSNRGHAVHKDNHCKHQIRFTLRVRQLFTFLFQFLQFVFCFLNQVLLACAIISVCCGRFMAGPNPVA